MAVAWEARDRRVIKPVLCHRNSCLRDRFFGLQFAVIFHSQKVSFTQISHCISGRKFKSRAYQLLV